MQVGSVFQNLSKHKLSYSSNLGFFNQVLGSMEGTYARISNRLQSKEYQGTLFFANMVPLSKKHEKNYYPAVYTF